MDLDRKQVVRSMGDELTLLPKKVQKALKTAINMCRIDSGETWFLIIIMIIQEICKAPTLWLKALNNSN